MCNPIMWTTRYVETAAGRLGWDAEAVSDGDLVVGTQVGRFAIANPAPGDPEYLHAYSLWDLPNDVDRAELLEIATEVTMEAKGIAVILPKGMTTVAFTYEGVVAGPDSLPTVDQLAAILPRVQRMLWNAARVWFKKLEEADDTSVLAGIEAATRAALADSDG
ncbi:hypothetical protein [Nocardioides kribbensis]|uniref:DUF4259 domain-containing protein n=1 Tax=Nocardioides kribbensis TaxID=305517 RepID=A0ABV1NTG6_9ACTN